MNPSHLLLPSLLGCACALAACDSSGGRRCVPGRQIACSCDDGSTSTQICQDDFTYDPCQCWDDPRPGEVPDDEDPWWLDGDVDSGEKADAGGVDAGPDGVLGECTSQSLEIRPIDVEYSAALDRIVMVSASPNLLSLLDPETMELTSVELPLEPMAVSVAPDGQSAAVAHNAYISTVDLIALERTDTIPTSCDADDIVLAGNGYAYVFPATDQWVDIHPVELATRVDHATSDGWSIYAGTLGRLHPGGTSMYGITRNLSPTDIERYDISAGLVGAVTDSPYHGDHPACSNVWFSEDGGRIFTGCGSVFRASPGAEDDMTYAGMLGGEAATTSAQYHWVAHSSAAGKVYGVPKGSSGYWYDEPGISATETQVRVFSEEFLALEGARDIPCLNTSVGKQRVYGRFVFPSSDGAHVYVVGMLDPETAALHDWVVSTLDP